MACSFEDSSRWIGPRFPARAGISDGRDDARIEGKEVDGGFAAERKCRSAEFDRLQVIVRRDDLAQLFLEHAVAAVGVGMVALHQLLEARLDLDGSGADLETQRVECFAFGV